MGIVADARIVARSLRRSKGRTVAATVSAGSGIVLGARLTFVGARLLQARRREAGGSRPRRS